MSRPEEFDRDALLLGHTAGELTAEQERALHEAAAADQALFDQLMEADALREALAIPEERHRAAAVLTSWDRHRPTQPEPEPERYAALAPPRRHRTPSLAADVFRSVLSTLATTVALRIGYTALAVVVVFIGAGWSYINPANYHPFVPPNTGAFGSFGVSGIMMGAGTIFFAYIGFDAVSTAAQECRNPQKDMPIGMFGSLALCTVLYILFSLVLTGLVPYSKLGVAAPVAVAIDRTPYVWLNGLIKFGVICGYTSVILVMLMGQSRVFYSMSRDGLVPAVFSQIHPRFHTPWRSNLLFFFFVAPFSAFLPLSVVGRMTSIGTLFAFAIVCAGVWVMRVKYPLQPRPFRTPWVPLVPILGVVMNCALMYSLGRSNWLRLAVWLIVGQAVYFLYGRRRSRLKL